MFTLVVRDGRRVLRARSGDLAEDADHVTIENALDATMVEA